MDVDCVSSWDIEIHLYVVADAEKKFVRYCHYLFRRIHVWKAISLRINRTVFSYAGSDYMLDENFNHFLLTLEMFD